MAVDKYIQARADYVRVDGEVDGVTATIAAVADALMRNRTKFSFSNTGVGLPADVMMRRDSLSADGNQWLSADQIMQHLARWHGARESVRREWQALTNEERAALQPPPHGVVPPR